MSPQKANPPATEQLFDRIVPILEEAKINVVRAVNSNMVIAYWLIGREIVREIQQDKDRAAYGKNIIETLSTRLTKRYGSGFSQTNLKYFRQFYQTYADREPVIRHNLCDPFSPSEKRPKTGYELPDETASGIRHKPCDVLDDLSISVEKSDTIQGFSPTLSWSHYRTLTKVKHKNERLFYEIEVEKEG